MVLSAVPDHREEPTDTPPLSLEAFQPRWRGNRQIGAESFKVGSGAQLRNLRGGGGGGGRGRGEGRRRRRKRRSIFMSSCRSMFKMQQEGA